MRTTISKLGMISSLGGMLLANAAHAAQEEVLDTIWRLGVYGCILFAAIVIVAVYFMRSRDKRGASLEVIVDDRKAIHSVAPDTPIIECVRTMVSKKIGALIVLDGEKLVGIFTERDALNKVLAVGLDPTITKISEVMTKNPSFVSPTTTVGDAMELVTNRRFRHLPVVDNGKVVSVISSGDLTHWLVKGQIGEVQELVDMAARSY